MHPNSLVNIGDKVTVKILEVEKEKRRISLGLKQCQENPWEEFEKNYKIDQIIKGDVKNITEFGIFIQLPYNLDGMVHLSDISWDKIGAEALKDFKKDQSLEVKILDIDVKKERIGLGIKQLTKNTKTNKEIGKIVTCVVKKIGSTQINVLLESGLEGIVKKNNIAKMKEDQRTDRFAIDEKLDAKIINFDKKKDLFELSIKELEIQEEKQALEQYGSSSSGASLGDILGAELEDKVKGMKKDSAKVKNEGKE